MLHRCAVCLLLVVTALGLASCRGSAGAAAASRGDVTLLRAQIDAGEKGRSLHLSDVAVLARATASHEVSVASGEAAIQRIKEVRTCAPELDDALTERRKKGGPAGAEAAMALFDAGLLSAGDVRVFIDSPDDPWRALGVRGLDRSRDRDARRKALLDPSPAVRRAALRVMEENEDDADLAPVFEAARVDPDPMVRTDAVRLMALYGRKADQGETVATHLRDLYPHADDALREDIGAAWAAPLVFAHGGREALRVLLASEEGPGAISAAAAVLREPGVVDPEIEAAARAELGRVIASGPRRNRLHAIAVAPLAAKPHEKGPSSLVVDIQKAALDEDLEVRVSALGRLVSQTGPAEGRAGAIQKLEAIAGRAENATLASRARLLLANAGDLRVQAWVEDDLHAADAWVRMTAVGSLVALGRATRAAPILADADPSVRTRGACSLLVAARLGSSLR